jgi:hypothetical protein
MKNLFEKNAGYILHLDGSAEAGDEITFTAKEGITGITIDSWIMPSEGREYIKPFLENIKKTFGLPLTVIRDMSEEIAFSVLRFLKELYIKYATTILFETSEISFSNIDMNSCEKRYWIPIFLLGFSLLRRNLWKEFQIQKE